MRCRGNQRVSDLDAVRSGIRTQVLPGFSSYLGGEQ